MLLVPEFPNDENGDVLRRMYESGDDLSRPRDMDFTVILPDEASAKAFAKGFEQQGFELYFGHSETVPDLPWDVVVIFNLVPTHASITEIEDQLAKAAGPFGGRNDGWGCFEQ